MVFFDHMATTPVFPEAREAVVSALAEVGHPGCPGPLGWVLQERLEDARSDVRERFGRPDDAVVFTSGASEANNQVIASHRGGTLVTLASSHPSVLEPIRVHAGRAVVLPVARDGRVDPVVVERALEGADLVSVLAANNETGVLQPVDCIARMCAERGVPLHVDACQAPFGPVPHGDFVTLSSHKFGGPPGVGVLLHRRSVEPLILGGGQQRGRRSGSVPIALVAGLAAACRRKVDRQALSGHMEVVSRVLLDEGAVLNSDAPTIEHGRSFWLPGIDAQHRIGQLAPEFVLSSGAACASGSGRPSAVLEAMGLPERQGQTVRIAVGWSTSLAEVEAFAEAWRRLA